MTRIRRQHLSVLALALTLAAPAAFAAKPGTTAGGPPQILPEETEATFQRGNARVSVETGLPVALYHVGHRVSPGEPVVMAVQYLLERGAELGLGDDLSDLTVRATRLSPAGDTVRFRQHVGGVPVYGAEIAVTVDGGAVVDFVVNGYKRLGAVDTSPRLAATEARALAFAYLDVQGGAGFERTGLVVYPGRGGARLAWQVEVEPRTAPVGHWEVLVDARSGEAFRVENKAPEVDGDGGVFEPDPLS